jgi:hypothetical protein
MGEDEQELWNRSEGEGDELRDLKGENPPPPFLRILPFHNTNVDLTMGRMQREKTESIRVQEQVGGQEVWPTDNTLPPKTLGFFPKFLCITLNSLLPLIF